MNKTVELINPIDSESQYSIDDIVHMLYEHFYFKYNSRGTSILPVIAIYSLYECIINELNRFKGKYL
jgi:DNA (cytosine-5)-methyltransferase 1